MNKRGFTLVELIVVMAIFVIVIGIPYKLFIQELKTTVREVSLSQTSIEHIPALETMRKDIETAGYGLFWEMNNSNSTYSEAKSSTPSLYSFDQAIFNDANNNKPPRAIIGKKDTSKNKFSYLVLKSTIFGLNKAVNHWTYIDKNNNLNIWQTNNSANYNNLAQNDRVIIMDAGKNRKLQGGNLYYTVSKDADVNDTDPSDYGFPTMSQSSVYLIYGVDNKNIRAPFNRIDYRLYDGTNDPSECAAGTHTLSRSIMGQTSGAIISYPILNCVADFQVVFGLDTTGDGIIDTWTQDTTSSLSKAEDVREELKQVRVYILMQNGTKDMKYNYPNDNITVGENFNGTLYGRVFDLKTNITNYKHYRWKVVTLVATPKNLE